MTLTIAADCTNVLVESDYLDPLNQTVTLTVKFNCDDEYLINVDVADVDITVDNTALGLDGDTLEDGVYYFELTVVQENGDTVAESECRFVNCNSNCLMLSTFELAATGDEEAIVKSLAYHALVAASGCTSCACEDLCLLYNATTLINCSENVKPCGCS